MSSTAGSACPDALTDGSLRLSFRKWHSAHGWLCFVLLGLWAPSCHLLSLPKFFSKAMSLQARYVAKHVPCVQIPTCKDVVWEFVSYRAYMCCYWERQLLMLMLKAFISYEWVSFQDFCTRNLLFVWSFKLLNSWVLIYVVFWLAFYPSLGI